LSQDFVSALSPLPRPVVQRDNTLLPRKRWNPAEKAIALLA